MDPISTVLADPRAREAFVLRVNLRGSWCLDIQDEAPLCLIAVADGSAWLRPADSTAMELTRGTVALVRGPRPYLVSSAAGTAPTIVIDSNQECHTVRGDPVAQSMSRGVRTWGSAEAENADAALVIGVYPETGQLGSRLLSALPAWLVQPAPSAQAVAGAGAAAGAATGLVRALLTEAGVDRPGQQAILDRLVDLVVMSTLRGWLTGLPTLSSAPAAGWCAGYLDPRIAATIDAMHELPARPWTVRSLADVAGLSRAAYAQRFSDLVGVGPIGYLTDWRLELASQLLEGTDATLDTIAREVGYGSGFALSSAFKRARGVSPRSHRAGREPGAPVASGEGG